MFIYSKIHKPKNTKCKAVALISLLTGALLFLMSGSKLIPYPSIVQLIGIVFMVYAIYAASFYLLREYEIYLGPATKKSEDDDEEELRYSPLDMLVYEVKGKRRMKVCHLSLSEFKGIRIIEKSNRKQYKKERKKMRYYTYDTEFLPIKQIEIQAEYEGESFSLLLPYDEEFISLLQANGIKYSAEQSEDRQNET